MIEQDEAVSAAEEWLALLDGGDYAACWERSASLMRTTVTKDQLDQSLRSVLVPMGSPLSRSLDGADYHETLPGAPDGRYWVLRFKASYTHKQALVETVTSMWNRDGWHVSGYSLR